MLKKIRSWIKNFVLAAISRNAKVITFMNDVLKSDDQFIEDIVRQANAHCLVEFRLMVDRLSENTILNIVKTINIRMGQDQSYRKNINQIFPKIPLAISKYLFSSCSNEDRKKSKIETIITSVFK